MDRLPFRATQLGQRYDNLHLPASLFLHDVRSLYNVGSFFRTADGAGAERIFLSGISGRPPDKAISKTALGAEVRVPWESVENPLGKLSQLAALGHEIAAIETSERAVDLFDWQPRFPVCLLFGHEVDGLAEPLLGACHSHVRIPMLGMKHSLNVASAGAVVLYELLRKVRCLLRDGPPGPPVFR